MELSFFTSGDLTLKVPVTPDKETVTGMNADLTVYRFVGVDNAVKMRSYGMCLEEYHEYCSYRQ